MNNTNKAAQKPLAVITGAAGGIGQAIAIRLAWQGYRIAMVDINAGGLELLLQKLGTDHLAYTTDVTDLEQVRHLVEDLINKTGRINVLINNAGMVVIKPFAQCSIEELLRENTLNYLSALYCIKEILPHMQKAATGVMVSISSLGAIMPMSESPNYTASKAALRGLMLSLNLTLKPYGIHAGCVCPSAVDTEMLHKEALGGGSLLNFLQEPLQPDAVAEAVWQVISKKKAEVCIPGHEGLSSKLGSFFPSILPRVLPHLERIGDRNRLRFIKKKHLTDH
jgi:short-subunit dehydrogenase